MSERRGKRPKRARSHSGHKGAEPAIIYGWHSAVAALQNPQRRIHRMLATRNALTRLAAEHKARDLPQPVEAREIERLTGPEAVHQGIALTADPLPEYGIDDVGEKNLLMVLDQVTDPRNVGAIIRTAAAFGGVPVIVTERHGPAESGVLTKAASGGLEHVPLVRVKNLARALDRLAEMDYLRLGLESDTPKVLEPPAPGTKTAVVLGAEGKGLRRLTREKCDQMVRLDIPGGAIASLNVSNAAALALYVLSRTPG